MSALASNDEIGALKLLNDVAKRFPQSRAVTFNLARVYGKLLMHEDAVAAYREVIKASPDNSAAWSNMAGQLLSLKRPKEADAGAQQAIKIDPSQAHSWRVLGFAADAQGQTSNAIRAFERASLLEPDNAQAWQALVILYQRSGQRQKAAVAQQRARRPPPPKPIAPRTQAIGAQLNASDEWGTKAEEVVERYIQAQEAGLEKFVRDWFAESVDYYTYGKVTRGFVVGDMRKHYSRWPKRTYVVTGPVKVAELPRTDTAAISFDVDFNVQDPGAGRWARGTAHNKWIVAWRAKGCEILSVRETVTNRRSSGKAR